MQASIKIFESSVFQNTKLTTISNENNTNAMRNMNKEYIFGGSNGLYYIKN